MCSPHRAPPSSSSGRSGAVPAGRCRPILQQLQEEHGDRIRIVKINADENMQTTVAYKALALPVMKVFRDGEVVKTIIGAKPKPAMELELAPFL